MIIHFSLLKQWNLEIVPYLNSDFSKLLNNTSLLTASSITICLLDVKFKIINGLQFNYSAILYRPFRPLQVIYGILFLLDFTYTTYS